MCVLGVLGVLELIVERECKSVVFVVVDENEGREGISGWSFASLVTRW